ncbi:MAG: GGDEF domain-containing protein [Acidobacteria bacterium]|nr:GGDEF domain-containing protein [Acidobacteriota bacterium]
MTPSFSTAKMLEERLNDPEQSFQVVHVQWLSGALDRLGSERFDAVMLSLSVIDAKSSASFQSIANLAPELPILTIASINEQAEAFHTVQLGADECVFIENLPKQSVCKMVSNAITRKQMLSEIRAAELEDAATGFYSRTGLESAAQQYFSTCRRTGAKLLVIVAGIDGATETTMQQFADAIRKASREFQTLPPPCLARIGTEEFAVLVVQDSPARLEAFMERVEQQGSVEWGTATYDAEYPTSPAILIDRAKQQKRIPVKVAQNS